MRDPAALYEVVPEVAAEVAPGLPLVVALTGFSDAGSAVSQLGDYLLGTLTSRTLAVFDTDELLDYRSRRPMVLFDEDHIAEVAVPELALHLVQDEFGQPFLALVGFEPDFQWLRVQEAIVQLIDRFQVSSTTWVHAIAMPVPHTRPIAVTVSGNRADLIESLSAWKPTSQFPGTIAHALEHRLLAGGSTVTGFALLVSHYLADAEYPSALLAALESISAATGLIFPTDRIREEGREFLARIEEQVSSNEETQRLVANLEARHDAYMEGTTVRSPLTEDDGSIPSAEQIASELERFLASRREGEEG